jgi:hypothetical protein
MKTQFREKFIWSPLLKNFLFFISNPLSTSFSKRVFFKNLKKTEKKLDDLQKCMYINSISNRLNKKLKEIRK